ncbi:MAG: hypothetical protein JSU72_14850 [Deltaproteobacteria bacterium]|nr:MAG: hypothetical protein JSU72_14850 [Deltaproteobacteria bacterium]
MRTFPGSILPFCHERLAHRVRRTAYLLSTVHAKRCGFHTREFSCIARVLVILLAATECAQLRPYLSSRELAERLQYGPDKSLEQLVDIAMARGYRAEDGVGPMRRVLELRESSSGSIHHRFFEIQQWGGGLANVFFLENKGSIYQTRLSRFPSQVREEVQLFLEGLPAARREQYKPLMVVQEKISRRMIIYETGAEEQAIEFTHKVISLEKSNLYGLLHLGAGSFIFFGEKAQKLFRKDFLVADERFDQLVHQFLRAYQPRSTI